MSINRTLPQIQALLQALEKKLEFKPTTHTDFLKIKEDVYRETHEMISETTLERLWGYSTRIGRNVSHRTLNVLSRFLGFERWEKFCAHIEKTGRVESDMFHKKGVHTSDLATGDELVITWQPDRICRVRYLGNNRFVAEETHNSKIEPGDTFSCLQFQEGIPAYVDNLTDKDGKLIADTYGIGLKNGISISRIK